MLQIITANAKKIYQTLTYKTYESEYAFTVLGFFWFIGYIGWYIFWRTTSAPIYENLQLRLIASILGLFLLLYNYWPKILKLFFPFFLVFSAPLYNTILFYVYVA